MKWNLYLYRTRKGNERDDSAPQMRRSFHLNLLNFFSEWCKGKYFYKGHSMNEQTLPQLYLKTLIHLHIRFAIKYLLSVPFIASVPIISFNSGKQYEINFSTVLAWMNKTLNRISWWENHPQKSFKCELKICEAFFHFSNFSFKALFFSFKLLFSLITKIKQTINSLCLLFPTFHFECKKTTADVIQKKASTRRKKIIAFHYFGRMEMWS